MKRSKEEIIRSLLQAGYVVSDFSLRAEGNYSVEDASWNYRDAIAHLNHIHPQVRNIPVVADDKKLASIFLQTIFGIRFPITVFDYETKEHTQTTFFSWAFFVVVVENVCESLSAQRAAVATHYQICSPPFFRWAHPVVRWVLKRNYRILMSQDVPVRERRGELRDWGYSFRGREENQSYRRSLNIVNDQVVPPEEESLPASVSFDLESDLAEGKRAFFGRDDHLGLQFLRRGNEVVVYPRICPHQGASLDRSACADGRLQCGWHGRKFNPLLTIDLTTTEAIWNLAGRHRLEIRQGRLHVSHVAGKPNG